MATDTNYPDRKVAQNVTIASGSVTSSAVTLHGTGLVGMILPALFQGSTVSMQGGTNGTTFFNLYSAGGTQLQTSAGASRYIYFAPTNWVGVPYVRAVAAATQTASRTIAMVSTP